MTQRIVFAEYHARPQPGAEGCEGIGGAHVTCWIAANDIDEGIRRARAEILDASWAPIELVSTEFVERDDFAADSEGLPYFEQALVDGEVLCFHCYPLDDADPVAVASWVEPIVLENPHVRLEPLTRHRAGELAEAGGSLETWRYFSRGPMELTEAGMAEFVRYLLALPATVPFAVVDPASGRAVGITTYLDIRPAHRGLEIGWTWYGPAYRATRLNPACKLLLMEHAFERLGAIRVCLKTDERNARSRAAILKLGAKFEGILRENIVMQDGFHRSTAMYSVLAGEWPGVRERLEARLG